MKKDKIIVSPMNWGLGHAARCVPLIQKFLEYDFEVYIAADGNALSFLEKEFPALNHIHCPGMKVDYPENKSILLHQLQQLPHHIKSFKQEQEQCQKIVERYKISAILSDNRFGLRSKDTYNVFMTHQLRILSTLHSSFRNTIGTFVNKTLIRPFDEVWVPDFAGSQNLSGKLSHDISIHPHVFFIGPLSRMTSCSKPESYDYKIMAIVSGPETQRTLFENLLVEKLKSYPYPSLLLQGLPKKSEIQKINKLTIIPHLTGNEFQSLMQRSEIIISRSGYSTVMDLVKMGKTKAIFVPTPSQTEQEFLSDYYEKEKIFPSYSQKQLQSVDLSCNWEKYSGLDFQDAIINNSILTKRILKIKELIK